MRTRPLLLAFCWAQVNASALWPVPPRVVAPQVGRSAWPRAIDARTLALRMQQEAGGLQLLDVRSDERFNGWPSRGDRRGGHLPGAVSLPSRLLEDGHGQLRAAGELRTILAARGLSPGRTTVVLADDPAASVRTQRLLESLGFGSVSRLAGEMSAWANDPSLPLERLPRYDRLVGPEWLREALRDAERAPLVLDVGDGGPEPRGRRHFIPGAIAVDTNELEADTAIQPRNWWNLLPSRELRRALEGMGITRDTRVVVYGHRGMAAARVVLGLMYAGVRDVRLLNGGLRGWVASGGPVADGAAERRPVRSFGAEVPAHPEYVTTLAAIRAGLSHGAHQLADVRSHAEFTGASTGYDDITRAGRLPGAVWARGGPDAQTLGEYEDEDGTVRSYVEVRDMWRREGLLPGRPVAFYCGTGWRASLAFLYAYWMGWPDVSVYDGGWYEWSMGPAAGHNQVVTGAR